VVSCSAGAAQLKLAEAERLQILRQASIRTTSHATRRRRAPARRADNATRQKPFVLVGSCRGPI
jgi:hypothetical protein